VTTSGASRVSVRRALREVALDRLALLLVLAAAAVSFVPYAVVLLYPALWMSYAHFVATAEARPAILPPLRRGLVVLVLIDLPRRLVQLFALFAIITVGGLLPDSPTALVTPIRVVVDLVLATAGIAASAFIVTEIGSRYAWLDALPHRRDDLTRFTPSRRDDRSFRTVMVCSMAVTVIAYVAGFGFARLTGVHLAFDAPAIWKTGVAQGWAGRGGMLAAAVFAIALIESFGEFVVANLLGQLGRERYSSTPSLLLTSVEHDHPADSALQR
jgi:hypothetical protein